MATPKKPKTAGKRPARSDAEWWDQRRLAAFEAIRGGAALLAAASLAGVNDRTLRDWQSDPRWQARLADRDRAAAIQAQATELAPLAALQSQVVAVVAELVHLALHCEDPRVRVAACRDILDRLRVQAAPEQSSGSAEVLKRAVAFGEAFVLNCANAMTTAALRAEQ
ncbi:MAG: hypothetical protein E6Q97_10720 [Desulfurellales bacterium]|nr:MAG: hypothetical protein E6Q97_10720 [Desulfurellales bacterium]